MSPKQIAARVKELGQQAVALTDHGNMFGVIQFWDACKKAEIQPIIGCEAYIAPGSRLHKEKIENVSPYFHITLLAMDTVGLHNLYKLTTLSYTEGFYHRPRIDYELLTHYNAGIICLSGCLGGKLASAFNAGLGEGQDLKGWTKIAYDEAERAKDVFGDRYYIELHRIIPIQDQIVPLQVQLAKDLGIKCTVACDSHYVNPDDYLFQDQIICLGTGKTIVDTERMKAHEGLYIKSEAEVRELFKDYPEWVDTTAEITERCRPLSLTEPFKSNGYIFPVFTDTKEHDIELFEANCWQGLEKRGLANLQEYRDRLTYEVNVIKKMEFCSYFLVVADYLAWARNHNIMTGPGRGSGAGALTSYCLYITDIDPIKYHLYFERFLNPGRRSMPDLDCDVDPVGRQDIFKYLINRYGADRVCQIATFSEFKPRGSIRDFTRVQGQEYTLGEEISKFIPPSARGHDPTWGESLKASPELKDEKYANIVQMAQKSEGLNRQRGIHAGGVVIGQGPLVGNIPLCTGKENEVVSQWDMNELERVGLVKMDILGVSSLTLISKCLELIKNSTGKDIDISQVPVDNQKTYELISAGETNGLFQLDAGGGIRDLCMQLRPKSIDDLSAIVSLYRPGPIDGGFLAEYVQRVNGQKEITYLIPQLEPVLKDTYGVMIYQEQAMRLAVELAGYTLQMADDLRKAIGKKIREKMAQEETRFIEGCIKNNISRDNAQSIFDMIKVFADYGFNRSHSVSYSYITYYTAYLKANYPLEFYCALLTQHTDERDKTILYLNDCKRFDLQVLAPDVNESNIDFTVINGTIRFGLAGIKGIAERAASGIVNARQNGPFTDLFDFYDRTQGAGIHKGIIESLAKAGALDSLNVSRLGVLDAVEDIVGHKKQLESYEKKIQTYQKRVLAYQEREALNKDLVQAGKKPKLSLKYPEEPVKPVRTNICMENELSLGELLHLEKEMLGLYLTSHPLYQYQSEVRQATSHTGSLSDHQPDERITIVGLISSIKQIITKANKEMCVITLEDLHGQCEVTIFNKLYMQIKHLLVEEVPVMIFGRIDAQADPARKILAYDVRILQAKQQPKRQPEQKEVLITFVGLPTEEQIHALNTLIRTCPGRIKTRVVLQMQERSFILCKTAAISSEWLKQLQKISGVNIECH